MTQKAYKSFAYKFEPFTQINLTTDRYNQIDVLIESDNPYWVHFEKPSKTLQNQLAKKFKLPKMARVVLFAEDVRSRCVKVEDGYVLIFHGVQPSTMLGNDDFPTLRFWIRKDSVLSLSTGKIDAIYDLQKDMHSMPNPSIMRCLIRLIEDLASYLEDSIYNIDEQLNKIEINLEYTEEATLKISSMRQDIIFLRRYILPQRDALISFSTKIDFVSNPTKELLKELSDGMLRQVEFIEMVRERAIIIQDNLMNQIGEIANRRMYLLTIIMLIFTPAFFIMGMFSMYLPLPGMNSHYTWWWVSLSIVLTSVGLFWLFKKKRWL